MKVFINPGHAPKGNPDPGDCNVYTGLRECDVAAEVGSLTAHYLNAVGIETEILQSDSLFISIHCNSAANPAANGTETWYCYGSKNGANLARYINGQILWIFDTADRGIKEARPGVNGLYVLTNTNMPDVLVELAFISNSEDLVLLTERQEDFARAIARGVTDYT